MKQPHSNPSRRAVAGVTLVEVVLALGVVAFAIVPLMGTVAVGHGGYRSASKLAVESTIINEVRTLVGDVRPGSAAVDPAYFTVDGVVIPASQEGAVYRADISSAEPTGVQGGDWEVLANRYAVVHIPSDKIIAHGVVHITPR